MSIYHTNASPIASASSLANDEHQDATSNESTVSLDPRIARIKSAIRRGTYETPHRMQTAIDHLIDAEFASGDA
jgi:anti-sigma28 factor (negative regulator of flagellin synthesis)